MTLETASCDPLSVDFLTAKFRTVGAVARVCDGFSVTTPWAIARYGPIRLTRGWWTLKCEGDIDELEVRVFDDTGLIFACRPARSSAVNLYVGRSTLADFDLVLSPWPAEVRFRQLSFCRLSRTLAARFLAHRFMQAMQGDRPLSRIWRAGRRILSGSSFGSRSLPVESAVSRAEGPSSVRQAVILPPKVANEFGFSYAIKDNERLDIRTPELVRRLFHSKPDVKAIYGDVLEGGTVLPAPQWDEVRATWFSLATTPIFFRDKIDSLTPNNAWAAMQETFRNSGASSVLRVPLPLAVRLGPVNRQPVPTLPVPKRAEWPQVSVIIPTKQRTDLLARCLEGLRTRTDYLDLEIVVVDNGADSAKLGALLKAERAFHRIVCVYDGGDFNFSRLINVGVRASRCEVVLLLNDDVIAQEPGWLHRMVDSALDASTGAVGARLVYSSGDIQHAGVMLGLGGICGHLWRNQSAGDAACNPHVVYPGRRMAVTGACLAVRRDAFDKIGGFDEVNYPVTLNDVDFCLRLDRAGFHTIYRGDALLLHDESQSRGSDDEERRKRERRRNETRAFRKMWGHLLDDDPFASPAFDRSTETGAVYIPASQIDP